MSIALLLAGSCISYQIYVYHRNMGEVMDIIVQFSNTEIGKIIIYWHQVSDHFRKLSRTKHATRKHSGIRQIETFDAVSESIHE